MRVKRSRNPLESLISAQIRPARRAPTRFSSGAQGLRLVREDDRQSPFQEAPKESPAQKIAGWLARLSQILIELEEKPHQSSKEVEVVQSSIDAGLAAIDMIASCDPIHGPRLSSRVLCHPQCGTLSSIRTGQLRSLLVAPVDQVLSIVDAARQQASAIDQPPSAPASAKTTPADVAVENVSACEQATHDPAFAQVISHLTRLDALSQIPSRPRTDGRAEPLRISRDNRKS